MRTARSRRRGLSFRDQGQAIFPGCAARAALKEILERRPTERSIIGSNNGLLTFSTPQVLPLSGQRDSPLDFAGPAGNRRLYSVKGDARIFYSRPPTPSRSGKAARRKKIEKCCVLLPFVVFCCVRNFPAPFRPCLFDTDVPRKSLKFNLMYDSFDVPPLPPGNYRKYGTY